MNEEIVEIIDIFIPCSLEEATAFRGAPLKLVARLVKGHLIWLAEEIIAEKKWLTPEEADQLKLSIKSSN